MPVDKNGTGTSTTLEYAYDDWAIAQMAKKLAEWIFIKNLSSVLKIIKMFLILLLALCAPVERWFLQKGF